MVNRFTLAPSLKFITNMMIAASTLKQISVVPHRQKQIITAVIPLSDSRMRLLYDTQGARSITDMFIAASTLKRVSVVPCRQQQIVMAVMSLAEYRMRFLQDTQGTRSIVPDPEVNGGDGPCHGTRCVSLIPQFSFVFAAFINIIFRMCLIC